MTRSPAAPAARFLSRATLVRTVAAACGGALMYLGFAPSTWWWAPIVGLAVLGMTVYRLPALRACFIGLVFAVSLFLPLLRWSGVYVGAVPWFALAIAEALLTVPFVALIAVASRRLRAWPVWAALLWVSGETLRAVFPFGGFPWGGIAFTQADGPLLPLAAVLGEYGVTVAVALAGFALGELARVLWRERKAARPLLPVALVVAPLAAGFASIPAVQTGTDVPTVPVALVQGNVPEPGLEFNARRRAVLNMHAAETERLSEAIRSGQVPAPRFVLWPENASDIDPYRNPDAADVINQAAREVGVPILVGAVVAADEPRRVYNMGIVWDPVTGPGQTYTKRHPVPFGEYMPMRDFFRIFSDKVDLITSEFLAGKRPGNLDIAGINVGDVICFEIVEDGIVRDVVNGGARMLVVQTNNATFGYTNETYQQQAMSRIRAVEHGRAVLIAATSGVSAVISPDGSVESTVGLFTAGFLSAEVPLTDSITLGTRLGAPVQCIFAAVGPLGLIVASVGRVHRRRKGEPRAT